MFKTLKKIEEEQGIFIIPHSIEIDEYEWHQYDFSITDDECSFNIVNNNNNIYATSDGFVIILTQEEFLKYKDQLMNTEYRDFCYIFYIPNFKGEMEVGVVNSDKDFALNDYILHQFNYNDEDIDVTLRIPDGLDILVVTDELIDSIFREENNKIMNDIFQLDDNSEEVIEYRVLDMKRSLKNALEREDYEKAIIWRDRLREYEMKNNVKLDY